jgi:hypothetical protein
MMYFSPPPLLGDPIRRLLLAELLTPSEHSNFKTHFWRERDPPPGPRGGVVKYSSSANVAGTLPKERYFPPKILPPPLKGKEAPKTEARGFYVYLVHIFYFMKFEVIFCSKTPPHPCWVSDIPLTAAS